MNYRHTQGWKRLSASATTDNHVHQLLTCSDDFTSPTREDDLYAPEQPAVKVLLLTAVPSPDSGLQARLDSIEGLIHLNHRTA
ncbi:hypothetical protein BX257_7117 [Streptomyces sp. 3212.3]|nr:hypothetical protein BX257_7117 [Streptomyces sp. 3212.3]